MIVLGLSGYAKAGKDTVGQVLVDEFGFTRLSFADKLRDVLYAVNPMIPRSGDPDDFWLGTMRLQELVDELGWQDAKLANYEIRQLLQRTGTEAGRVILGDNLWVDAAFSDTDPNGRYVVTDCRFWSEAKGITARGGEIWRIAREGTGPVNDHPSETELDDYPFDQWIVNNGILEELQDCVRDRAARYSV